MHAPIHVVDAPEIVENENSELVEFIDKHITCAFPDEIKYLETSKLFQELQTHHHTTTGRKKKGVANKFNAPWSPSQETRVFFSDEKIDKAKAEQDSY